MADKKLDVYQIDKDIPLPEPPATVVPLGSMEVGDSILFPAEERSRVWTLASKMKARSGKVFTTKTIDENNARVWRIE